MSQKKRYIIYIVLTSLVLFLAASCSFRPDQFWMKTNEDVWLWVSSSDTTKSFLWNGNVIDSVPNGSGVLSVIDTDGHKTDHEINMFYGAQSIEDVVTMDDGSQYVGTIVDDKMEGFGVLVKAGELYIGHFHESKPNGFLKLYRNGKLYYEGNWKDGAFNGEGTLYKEDGCIKKGTWENGRLIQTYYKDKTNEGFYDGYVLNGKPDGIGSMLYRNGSYYEGSWSNGLWSGSGTYYTKTDTLTGEFVNGKLNGTGIYKSQHFLYDGEWLDNKPDGIGYAETNDSSFYSGMWSDGQRNGFGDIVFPNGDSYSGDWTNNQFNGIGTYTYAQNGDVYYGEWKDGVQNGLGTYTAKSFEYTGNWEEGWINGDGRITYANNDFYEGNFVENERYGVGYYQFSNGNSYEGEFIDGIFNGLGIFRFADGNVYEGEFQDGKIKGDGTLYYIEGKDTLAITANWDGSNQFPKAASILFSNGDLYEGELVNGFPTENGIWTTAEEREKGEIDVGNSLSRANEFYKKHRDTWNKAVMYTSIALSVVEVAAPVVGSILIVTGVGAPAGAALVAAGKVAGVANVAINVADAAVSTASAGIDTYEAILGDEDYTEELTTLGTEIAINAAFVAAPKVLKKLPIRKAKVLLSASAKSVKNAATSSLITLSKNKTFGKMIKIVKDKSGALQKSIVESSPMQRAKNLASSVKKKFESTYLKSLLPKTLIYKKLQQIKAKGPIKLKKKELDYLMQNADKANLKSIIKVYTGNENGFLEFFIRLADGDKKQVAQILEQPNIRKYINSAIRSAKGEGGYHEWLMTKNFKSFLLDEKWGEDGHFLAIALTELTQKTRNVNFKIGGGHPSSGRPNSSISAKFHNGLAEVIDQCNTKEELFVNIRAYAKKALTEEAYRDFNAIFKSVLQTVVE